jgi:hypothetical protein
MEHRDNYRMPVQAERSEARVRIGRKWLACQLIDESTGGFLISLVKMPRAKVNQPMILQTPVDAVPVRMAWKRPIGNEVLLGLERLPEPFKERSGTVLNFLIPLLVGFGCGYVLASSYAGHPLALPTVRSLLGTGTPPLPSAEEDASPGDGSVSEQRQP